VGPIEERIADIEQLDQLRQSARMFQQDAIEALTTTTYLPQPRNQKTDKWKQWKRDVVRQGWREPGDDVEKAMMLQALLKAQANKQGHSENQQRSRDNLVQDLLRITVADCNKTENVNPGESLDNVPIMRCALVLQALKASGRGLTRAALACFYRIVVELGEVVGPTWSIGAARASADAPASAFITGECARALIALEDALLQTAEVAELVGLEKKRINERSSEIPVWAEQEEAFRAMAFYASLTPLLPHLAIELPSGLLRRIHGLGENRTTPAELASLVNDFETELTAALNHIPSAADILSLDAPASAVTPTRSIARFVAHGQATAAHNSAQFAVTKLIEGLKDEPAGITGGARVALNLKEGARFVHDLLDPVTRFAETIIDREVARPQLSLPLDGAELVFAACLFGRLSDWQQPKVKSALQIARQLLTPNGRLMSLQPFNVQGRGYRLNVATLEVTRRLAELAANVATELDPAFVEKVMRPFEDTRVPGRDDTNRGWMMDPRGHLPQSEWWVTALAVDALGKVIEMLNAAINRQVLQQFHVRPPAEIDLELGGLFYPDYGLTTLRRSRTGWDRNVAVKLQGLRIHAGYGPADGSPRYSLILYGPPGTGKTTLVEAIAKSANVPLVEITPSDILVGGEEAIERRTRHVFLALSMLTNVVILFDEFDPILQNRAQREGGALPQSIFEFLTPGMLPKLKRLHESARANRVSYVLATNFVYNLDPAVIRQGRFDDQHGIYPPDAISRLGRLCDQLKRQDEPELKLAGDERERRALQAVSETHGGAMDQIAKPGWYSAKKFAKGFPSKSVFHFIEERNRTIEDVRREAQYDQQWQQFIRQRSAAKPAGIRELMSDQEKWYWDDWSAVHHWDEELGLRICDAGATVSSIAEMLAQWARDRTAREAEPPTITPATT